MKRILLFLLAISVAPASAQQQPDPAAMIRLIPILQDQRNAAMDAAAVALSKAAQLTEEVQKLKAELAKINPSDKSFPPQSP